MITAFLSLIMVGVFMITRTFIDTEIVIADEFLKKGINLGSTLCMINYLYTINILP